MNEFDRLWWRLMEIACGELGHKPLVDGRGPTTCQRCLRKIRLQPDEIVVWDWIVFPDRSR